MNTVIITSRNKGFASYAIPILKKSSQLNIKAVIFSDNKFVNKKKHYRSKLQKILKIGLLGALNGIRIRKWYIEPIYNELNILPISEVCESLKIPFYKVERVNSDITIRLLEDINPDIGLSLGNSYISSKVFSKPRLGMLNVHHEVLPDFQSAQSVLWQIYYNTGITGYSIHEINKKIDQGNLILVKKMSLKYYPTLKETVFKNLIIVYQNCSNDLVKVLVQYPQYKAKSIKQLSTKTYTTPSIWQFLRMLRNNRKGYKRFSSY